MRPWSESIPRDIMASDIARINAAKLDIAITALGAIGICKKCGRHCAIVADRAMREMGKVNMHSVASGEKA